MNILKNLTLLAFLDRNTPIFQSMKLKICKDEDEHYFQSWKTLKNYP
jgi:hypothetical protein